MIFYSFNSLCEIHAAHRSATHKRWGLSILYVRSIEDEEGGVWRKWSFNSLCEILGVEKVIKMDSVWFLSILYVRFSTTSSGYTVNDAETFNSLCEIPRFNGATLQTGNTPFNSLCEIPTMVDIIGGHFIAFNSLCEIPVAIGLVQGCSIVSFNSLCEIPTVSICW